MLLAFLPVGADEPPVITGQGRSGPDCFDIRDDPVGKLRATINWPIAFRGPLNPGDLQSTDVPKGRLYLASVSARFNRDDGSSLVFLSEHRVDSRPGEPMRLDGTVAGTLSILQNGQATTVPLVRARKVYNSAGQIIVPHPNVQPVNTPAPAQRRHSFTLPRGATLFWILVGIALLVLIIDNHRKLMAMFGLITIEEQPVETPEFELVARPDPTTAANSPLLDTGGADSETESTPTPTPDTEPASPAEPNP